MSNFDPRQSQLSPGQRVVGRLFPERQVVVRSEGQTQSLTFSTTSQVSAVAIAALVAGWVGFSSYMYINNEAIIAEKQEDVARAQSSYRGLLAQVSVYQDKIGQITDTLEENHNKSLALTNTLETESKIESAKPVAGRDKRGIAPDATSKAQDESRLAVAALDLQKEQAAQERAMLREQLKRLGQEMVALAQKASLPDDQRTESFGADDMEIRRVTIERDLAANEVESLKGQVDSLQKQVVDLQQSRLSLVQNFSVVARNRTQDLQDALKGTGLDIDALLKSDGSANQGGPFIPLDKKADNAEPSVLNKTLVSLNRDYAQWNSLQGLAEVLPIGQPVKDYRVTSTFGPRQDPVNGLVAVHQGLDLSAPYQTPVAASGDGRVSYAGWRGRYGRVVEIDHGNGLRTRYGHLYKILVRKGDRVDRNTKIGLLGNSGRSTGPHVHYEVIVNGQPRDPSTFIKAGINVF